MCRTVSETHLHTEIWGAQLRYRLNSVLAFVSFAVNFNSFFAQLVLEVRNGALRSGIIPDDSSTERLPGLPVPSYCRFPLVRDSCGVPIVCETRWTMTKTALTNYFDAILRPPTLFQILACFLDALLRSLLNFQCIMFVPASCDLDVNIYCFCNVGWYFPYPGCG